MTDAVLSVRERLGPLGIWTPTDGLAAVDAAALAARIETLGYSALWLPETFGRDPFVHVAYLAERTSTLLFATGIANIHHRHPGAMRQAADALAEQTGGRFVLGLGVSHASFVEGLRGLDYSRPVATMRAYLEGIEASPYMGPRAVERPARVLAALGPKMLALAGELADGAHPYWTTPTHTAQARRILGPDKLLCVEQKVVLSPHAGVARATGRQALDLYADLPNYRNNWLRLGFSDDDIDRRSDEFVDALVAWGEADTIRGRIQEHLDAGADHVCLQIMTPEHPFRIDDEALVALAPSAER